MKVKVTKEEKKKLDHYYMLMCEESLPLYVRKWAKQNFDWIYDEALKRTIFNETITK